MHNCNVNKTAIITKIIRARLPLTNNKKITIFSVENRVIIKYEHLSLLAKTRQSMRIFGGKLRFKPYCALCNHRNGTEVRLGRKRVSNTSILPFLAGNQAKECFTVNGSSYQTRAGFLKSNKVVSLGSDPVQGSCYSSNKFSL